MNKKTILITGGTGFLGSNLIKKLLLDEGIEIILLKRSFSNTIRIHSHLNNVVFYNIDEINMESIFLNHKIDTIIHCATDYGRKAVDALQTTQANLMLPLQLLQLAHRHHVPRFINTDTILDNRMNHYSLSKKQFHEWLAVFCPYLICINISLGHFYGPFDDTSKFVSYIIYHLLTEQTEIQLTPGEQKRDFIFIDDVINAFDTIINAMHTFKNGLYEFQVGSGKNIRIRDLVELLYHLTENKKTKLNFGAFPYREHEVMETQVDLTAISQLGWQPQISLHEGLRKTIEFEKSRNL